VQFFDKPAAKGTLPVNLDEMNVKQLRKHAGDVAKALARKEAARAKKLRKRVVSYTQELGENLGEFFGKTMSKKTEETTTKASSTKAPSTKASKTKATASKASPTKMEDSKSPKYIEPDGTPRQRLGKWSEKYTKKQIESMKQ
jgi:hypothetical protein